jgi:hypothetical protein
MGVFTFLTRKKRNSFIGAGTVAVATKPELDHLIRSDLMDVVKAATTAILEINLQLMGLSIGNLPHASGLKSKRSRGYLLGLATATLEQFGAMEPTGDEFVCALATTFMTAHGRCDGAVGLETIDLAATGDVSVREGVALAYRDVGAVYSGEAWASPTGLWLIHHGDDAALRCNLDLLEV